jgi:enoyl-CoA hydratase/carnithine racemase
MSIVFTEDHGAVRHVVLNRPEKRNAFNGELVEALGRALRETADDSSVKCVVVRGEGKVFSAGIDLSMIGSMDFAESLRPFRRKCIEMANLCEEMLKPVIAQIHGACIGLGMELALACDLRVLSDDAVMSLPETRVGLIPDVGGSSRLPAVVGLGRAKEIIMTSRVIAADEAARIGLANRVAPHADLPAATQALIDELLGCSPLAVGLAKRVLDSVAKPTLAATLEQEVTAQQVCIDALSAAAAAAAPGAATDDQLPAPVS